MEAVSVRDRILGRFPSHTHPLTLASDPDGLLAEESLLTELCARGFTVIDEVDPVELRRRVESARPWSAARPVIVQAPAELNRLPYDLWQEGHKVSLSLHEFFPNLAYPAVSALTPTQRWRLSLAPPPPNRLGPQGTVEFILRAVFVADLSALEGPARLIAWLNEYHQLGEPMPSELGDYLLRRLQGLPVYSAWPLGELLAGKARFADFVNEQWLSFVARRTGQGLQDSRTGYVLGFESNDDMQDTIPRLLRSAALRPAQVARPEQLPAWAQPAVIRENADRAGRRGAELLTDFTESCEMPDGLARWEDWQTRRLGLGRIDGIVLRPQQPAARWPGCRIRSASRAPRRALPRLVVRPLCPIGRAAIARSSPCLSRSALHKLPEAYRRRASHRTLDPRRYGVG